MEPLRTAALEADEVHVWLADLAAAARTLAGLESTLSNEERRRSRRFVCGADGRRFVLARGLLRRLLGRYLGVAAQDVRLACGPHGKPLLSEPCALPLRFNLSHSADAALYAVALGREVGVDIERTDGPAERLSIARRFFAEPELRLLSEAAPDRQRELFGTLWTIKEACLKAEGTGLCGRLRSVVVRPCAGAGTAPRAVVGGRARWSVRTLRVPAGYAAAVAVEGAGWSLRQRLWTSSSGER